MKKGKSVIQIACALGCLLLGAADIHASGFAIFEQGVRGLGTAYAGAAAQARHASTIFFNPAGLASIPGNQLEAGLHYIMPEAEFHDDGSRTVTGQSLNIYGDGDEKAGENIAIPNLYYAHSVSDHFKAGIGVHGPYGLRTEYNKRWVGRYHAVESELRTININPSFAYRLNPQFAVGAGVSFEYANATLSNMADLGLIGALAGVPGAVPQRNDAFVEVEGDDWGYGFNLGLMYEPIEGTRVGLAFRSSVTHDLEGEVDWRYNDAIGRVVATNPLIGVNGVDGDASATVELPETITLAFHHAINAQWAVMADVTWTHWSRLEELRIAYETGQPDTVVTLDWDDTWRYALGLTYQPFDRLEVRFGAAYDETPIPNEEHRTPRIPDEDRIWLAIGAGFQITDRTEINFGYTHLFVEDPAVNKPATGEDLVRGALIGDWDGDIDIVSLNVVYSF